MEFNLLKLNAFIVFILLSNSNYLKAQTTTHWGPDGFVKIGDISGGFEAEWEFGDRFSRDHDQAGDINGDSVFTGARSDDDGATDARAVYVVFLINDGTVLSHQKIPKARN